MLSENWIPSDKWGSHSMATQLLPLNLFLRYSIPYKASRVTHEQAEEKALAEYEKFRVVQDREIMSDFDHQLKMLFDGAGPKS